MTHMIRIFTHRSFLLTWAFGVALCGPGVAASAAEPPEGIARYHEALRGRPEPGYLFERFCREWLERADRDSLREYLMSRAEGGDATDQLLLAYFYANEGERVAAIRRLRSIIDQHPDNARAWLTKGRLEAQTLDLTTALSDFEHAASLPDIGAELRAEVQQERARLLIRLDRRDEALGLLGSLAAERPQDLVLREDLVHLLVDEGLYADAVETLRALIDDSADPRDRISRRIWLAQLHDRAGDVDKAIAALEEGIDSVGVGSWLERETISRVEEIYRRKDDLTGLEKKLAEFADEHPQRAEFARARARVLGELGRHEAAADVLLALVERTPGDRELRVRHAETLAEAGELGEAIERLEGLAETAPGDADLRFTLAEFLARADRPDDAVSVLREALGERPSPPLLSRALRVLRRHGHGPAAVELAENATAAAPGDEELSEILAATLAEHDQRERAVGVLERLIAETNDPVRAVRAARSLARYGSAEDADIALAGRDAEFGEEPEYLRARVELGALANRWAESVDPARRWLATVDEPRSADRIVVAAARAVDRAGETLEMIERLRSRPELEPHERGLLAELLFDNGQAGAADEVLRNGEDAGGRLTLQRVRLLRESSREREAAAVLSELLEGQGADPSLAALAVDLFSRTGESERALELVGRWKVLAPGSLEPWLREADLLTGLGRRDESLDALKTAARRFPDQARAAESLANAYRDRGRFDDADRVLWRLFEEADSTTEKLRWIRVLAEGSVYNGRLDRIVEELEGRLRRNRNSIGLWLALAETHRVADRYPQQREALLEASRVEDDNVELLLGLAGLEERWGDAESAASTLRRAMSNDPSGRAMGRLARLLLREGRVEEAMGLVEESSGLSLDHRVAFANTLMLSGDWDAAARLAGPLGDPVADYLAAVALEEQGRTNEALERFLQLVETDTSALVSPLITSGAPDPLGSLMRSSQGSMPPDAELVSRLGFEARMAYAYRTGRRSLVFGVAPGAAGGLIQLPGSPEQLRRWAIVHAVEMGAVLGAEEQDLVADRLASAGVPIPRYLLERPLEQLNAFQVPTAGLKHLAQEDDTALALYLASAMNPQAGLSADAEILRRGVETFQDDYPVLALSGRVALLAMARTEAEQSAAWEEIKRAIESVESPTSTEVMAIVQISGMSSFGMAIELPDGAREFIVETAGEWYPELDPSDQAREFVFAMMIRSSVEEENWERIARLIQEEVRVHQKNPSISAGSMSMFTGRSALGGRHSLTPLSFPPQRMGSLPESVQSLFSGQMGFVSMLAGGLDPQQLYAAIPADADPILRAYVAGAASDNEAFQEAIRPALESETPSYDAYILAASKASSTGDAERAISLLEKATFLPMTRGQRERIDEAIVAEAITSDVSEDGLKAARRSALRLRLSFGTPQRREELILAMEELGLDEAAEQERERVASRPAPASPFAMNPTAPAARGTSPADRIREKLAAGENEDAVRLIVREAERVAQMLASGNDWAARDESWQTVLRMVRSNGLAETVIERASPRAEAPTAAVARFALVLEALGETERAIQVYDSIQNKRLSPLIAARIPRVYAEADRHDAAVDAMLRLEPVQLAATIQSLVSQWQMGGMREPDYRIPRLLAAFLERASEEQLEALQSPMLGMVLDRLANYTNSWNSEEARPSLYNAELSESQRGSDRYKKARESHDRLARAMLRAPASSQGGFSAIVRSAEAGGENLDQFVDLARQAIRRSADAAQTLGMSISYSTGGRFEGMVASRDPISFYASRATGEAMDELARGLREDSASVLANRVESVSRLYRSPEEDFYEVARERLAVRPTLTARSDPLRDVILALEERGLPASPLLPDVTERIEQAARSPQQLMQFVSGSAGQLRTFLGLLADESVNEAVQGLEDVAEALVGPADNRARFIERNSRTAGSFGAGAMRVQAYATLLRTLASDERFHWEVLDRNEVLSDSESFAQGVAWGAAYTALREHVREVAERGDASTLLNYLYGAPFLQEVERFRPVENTSGSDRTLFGSLVETAQEDLAASQRAELVAALREAFPTFGGAVVARAIETSDPGAVLAAMAPWEDQIVGLDEERRSEIASIFTTEPSALDDDPSRAIAGALFGARRSELAQRVEELTDPNALSSMQAMSRYDQDVRETLKGLVAAEERELVETLLRGSVRLYEKQSARMNQMYGRTRGLESVLPWQYDRVPAWYVIELMAAVAYGSSPTISDQIIWRLSDALGELVDESAPLATDPSDRSSVTTEERRARAAFEELEQHRGEYEPAVFIATASRYADDNLSDTQRGRTLSWARERAPGHSGYWEDVWLAIEIANARDRSDPVRSVADAARIDRAIDRASRSAPPPLAATWIGSTLQHFHHSVGFPLAERRALSQLVETLDRAPQSASSEWIKPLLARAATRPEHFGDVEAAEVVEAVLRASVRGQHTRLISGAAPTLQRRDSEVEHSLGQRLLEVAMLAGDDALIARLLRANNRALQSDMGSWGLLLDRGRADDAADAVRSGWPETTPSFPAELVFSESSLDHAEAVIERLADPALAEIVRLLVALRPDPAEEPPSDGDASAARVSEREERAADLAERFDPTIYQSDRQRRLAMAMLATSRAGLEALGPRLQEEADAIDLTPLSRSGRLQESIDREIVHAAIVLQAERGDYSMLNGLTETLSLASGTYTGGAHPELEALGELLVRLMDSANPESLGPSTDLSEAVSTLAASDTGSRDRNKIRAWNFALQHLNVRSYADWVDEAVENGNASRETLERIDADAVIAALMRMTKRDRKTAAQRLQALRDLFGSESFRVIVDDHDGFFEDLVDDGYLTAEELEKHGPELAELAGDESYMVLARGAADLGLRGLAETYWIRACESREDAGAEIHYISHMLQDDFFALAKERLLGIEDIPDDDRDEWDRLLENANDALDASESPEETP